MNWSRRISQRPSPATSSRHSSVCCWNCLPRYSPTLRCTTRARQSSSSTQNFSVATSRKRPEFQTNLLMAYDSRFSSAEAAQNPLAELILALCGTAVRVAIREEIADTREPSATQIKIRAITLARQIVEKLND